MLLGIDAGGTHTDGVVIDGLRVKAKVKVRTNHDNLLFSIKEVLAGLFSGVRPEAVSRLTLSTTLSTNAIVLGQTEQVGTLVVAGPGIDPKNYRMGEHFYVLKGSIDHRGTETTPLHMQDVEAAISAMKKSGVSVFAVVGKFSFRNPVHEQALFKKLMHKEDVGAGTDFISLGHMFSGMPGFPRRIATAYYNSAVWRVYVNFVQAVEKSIQKMGIKAPVYVLKADGGTTALSWSKDRPVESVLAGPAASVMGVSALCDVSEDGIILDIGGTTTDIALLAKGMPVAEGEGMEINSRPTLVRSLKIRSIAVGGDAAICLTPAGKIVVKSRPMQQPLPLTEQEKNSNRKEVPSTLTDALNFLRLSAFGNTEASQEKIKKQAELWGLSAEDLAEQAVQSAARQIVKAVFSFVAEVNQKPVYTLAEMLKSEKIIPQCCYIMGGPAKAMAKKLQEVLKEKVKLVPHHSVANAIGAALTRPTLSAELFADTQKGYMRINELDIAQTITRHYTKEQAEQDVKTALGRRVESMGQNYENAEPEIINSSSFTMINNAGRAGRNIRVTCQIRPGVLCKGIREK